MDGEFLDVIAGGWLRSKVLAGKFGRRVFWSKYAFIKTMFGAPPSSLQTSIVQCFTKGKFDDSNITYGVTL
jgi:hypothetical protein